MDVARFKYPMHWVPLSDMYNALLPQVLVQRREGGSDVGSVYGERGKCGWRGWGGGERSNIFICCRLLTLMPPCNSLFYAYYSPSVMHTVTPSEDGFIIFLIGKKLSSVRFISICFRRLELPLRGFKLLSTMIFIVVALP